MSRHFTACLLAGFLLWSGASDLEAAAPQTVEQRARDGDVEAQIEMGVRYRDGEVVERDYAEALKWYRLAAGSGDPRALDHLGWMYFRGYGVRADFARARELFERSAAGGHHQGMFNLGRMYADALAGKQDYARAARIWLDAHAAGSKWAARRVGELHLRGLGVEPDAATAARFFRAGLERGDLEAAVPLGWLYWTGRGVAKDRAMAEGLWRRVHTKDEDRRGLTMFEWIRLRERADKPGAFVFLRLNHVRQGYNMCGPTATAMALSYQAAPVDPYTVKSLCPGSPPGTGTDWALLVGAMKQLGRSGRIVTFEITDAGFQTGLKRLLGELDAGNPVLVDIRERDNQSGSAHTVVAVGYDRAARQLIVQDPAITLPGIRLFSFDTLRDIWHSRGYTRTARSVARPIILLEPPTASAPSRGASE